MWSILPFGTSGLFNFISFGWIHCLTQISLKCCLTSTWKVHHHSTCSSCLTAAVYQCCTANKIIWKAKYDIS
ncbi:hypothetical protein DFH08DRAFT_899763 [Mycena albidolilacea]|uniref:Uncharacterized protein n=1 Tax=Mycena albidolilacea TaxID=1033008 RepID=A0AAD6Z6B1_9AGAR|nr:hypothetical protein DFH08DRAFT_899763 [Mycena albidolilacea]